MKKNIKRLKIVFLIFLTFFGFGFFNFTFAGNIDVVDKYAWSENIGWINFGTTEGNVIVTDTAVTGYAWSSNFGWINLNPAIAGVLNNGNGILSGYAWGEKLGWINFNGVTIDSEGYFHGYASGDITGQISFNCANTNSCNLSDFKVRTSWRPSGAGGGAGGGEPPQPPPESPPCSVTVKANPNPIPANENRTTITVSGTNLGACSGSGTFTQTEGSKTYFVSCSGVSGITSPCSNSVTVTKTALPGTKWCEKENQYIVESEWTEKRCLLSIPPTKWCEKEGRDILEEEWTEERCLPPAQLRWCEKEERDIPVYQWTEERCLYEPSFLTKWCETEKKNIPIDEWTEKRCIPSEEEAPPVQKTKWCKKENRYILESDWSEKRCALPLISELGKAIPQTVKKVKEFVESPTGSTVTKTISTLGLAVGAAGVAASGLFIFPLSFRELVSLIFRLMGLIFTAFGLKKRIPPWGTVYDSVTKQPLDPAYVILEDLSGNEVVSSITDLDGRYGFLVEPGIYRIIANKTNYSFPSKKLAGRNSDELYSNLYFGENLEIKKEGEIITKNIPLDPEKFDWNEFIKRKKGLLKFYSKVDLWIRQISDLFFVAGFFVAVIALIIAPYPYNMIVMALYIFLLILRLLGVKPKAYGWIGEKTTGYPLSFAILRVFSAELNREIFHRVSDKFGRYYCLLPKGRYFVKIEKKNDDGSYSLVYTSEIIHAKRGIIREKFRV